MVVFNKRIYILLLAMSIAVTGSVAAWFYFDGQAPRKSPVKAKSVQLYQPDKNGKVLIFKEHKS